MKQMITKELIDKVNSQGSSLTTDQWFTINNYIGMQKFNILNNLQYIKPNCIYDVLEKAINALNKKEK